MKICWDNLEKFSGYNQERGEWFIIRPGNGRTYYSEIEACKNCGEPFLAVGSSNKDFCCHACAASYIMKSKRLDINVGDCYGAWTVIEQSEKRLNSCITYLCRCACGSERIVRGSCLLRGNSQSCGCYNSPAAAKQSKCFVGMEINNIKLLKRLGRVRRVSNWLCECLLCGTEFEAISSAVLSGAVTSCGCSRFKVGIKGVKLEDLNLISYETYKDSFGSAEEVKHVVLEEYNNFKVLNVKCAYCGDWFMPSASSVSSRLQCLAGRSAGEGRFYCSDGCKVACPIYNRAMWPKGHKPATSREVQPELRQMVLERDNWTCQYGSCGKTNKDAELHCHHFEGIYLNPIESADLDMCITFCKKHHKLVHEQRDCRYFELTCNYYLTTNK